MGEVTRQISFKKDFLPTLSVCMIVKDEEANLKRLLPNLKSVVDELVIVDTGSSDKTKEVALQFTDKVYDFEWCDDFSAARNESLKYATKDYILWLDGDDHIAKQDIAILKFHLSRYPTTGVFLTLVDKRPDREFHSLQLRVFPNHKGLQFKGRIHEQISFDVENSGLQYSTCQVNIIHLGYDAPEAVEKKLYRNLDILKQEIEENENDFKTILFTAKTLLGVGKTEEAKGYVDKAINLYKEGKAGMSKENVFMAFLAKATLLSIEGKPLEAINVLEEVKHDFYSDAMLSLTLGEMYFRQRMYSKAYSYLKVLKDGELKLGLQPIDTTNMRKNLTLLLVYSSLAVGDFDLAEVCIQRIMGDVEYKIQRG